MSVQKQDEHCEWCEKQEKLLIKWAEKAAGYRWLHNHARLFYKKQNDWLSYPSIIIASITGVGGFAVLNVLGGILTSISKFSQSLPLSEAHSAMCIQWSKFYRSIDMELSLDVKHRSEVVEFLMKSREEYDKLLDDAPDIPAISIQAFLVQFPDKENKPDVCNGLSIVVSDDAASVTGSQRAVTRWLGAFKNVNRRRSKDIDELERVDSV
jgi:hypothetical protein